MSDGTKIGCQNEVVCNLVKSSISQAQKSHETYVQMSEAMLSQNSDEADMAFNQKALDFTKQDAGANFAFALKLLEVENMDEVIRLQDEHATSQTEEMARRVAELQSMANAPANLSDAADVEPAAIVETITETTETVEPVADDIVPVVELDAPVEAPAVVAEDESNLAGAVATAALAGVGAAALLSGDDEAPEAIVETVVTEGEVDSGIIAAEIEDSVAPDLAAIVEEAPEAGSEQSIEAEIEALAGKISEAKNIEEIAPKTDELIDISAETPNVVEGSTENLVTIDQETMTEASDIPLISEPLVTQTVPDLPVDLPPVGADVTQVEMPAVQIPEVKMVSPEAPVLETPIVDASAIEPVVVQTEAVQNVVEMPTEPEVATGFEEVPTMAEPVVTQEPVTTAAVNIPEVAAPAMPESPVDVELPEISAIVDTPAAPAPAQAIVEPQPVEDDLSARLDAVREMLQGGDDTATTNDKLKDAG